MNAKDIAKALKCCYPPEGNNSCDGCPYDGEEETNCTERNFEYKAGEIIESLLSQLDAAIAGQETLQKAFAESQRREREARLEVCRRCPDGEIIDGVKHYPCDGCEWQGPQKGEPHETV